MLNRTILVGRLTKDVDLSYTPSGVPVAKFTLAVNRTFKNANGEQEADFINVVVWRKPAENAANYLKKGSLAGIDGRIQTRNFEGQDGKRVYITEVVAEGVQFLDSKPRSEGQSDNPRMRNEPPKTNVDDDPFSGGNSINVDTDSLPF